MGGREKGGREKRGRFSLIDPSPLLLLSLGMRRGILSNCSHDDDDDDDDNDDDDDG